MSYNISARFVFRKRGVFYFVRRVPRDLASHYSSPRISFSLRTRSAAVAATRAAVAAERLERHWHFLRAPTTDLPGKHLLRSPAAVAGLEKPSPMPVIPSPTLSEATVTYKHLKGAQKGAAFERTTDRAVGYLMEVCGDIPILEITRKEANAFRDHLLRRDLTGSSIARMVSCVRAVINLAASEAGIDAPKAFTSLNYDRHAGVRERLPIPMPNLRTIQAACLEIDDDARWLVALVSDTGMRLSEAAGLAVEDLVLSGQAEPHAVIVPRPWRTLKTASSNRKVPLVGAALWAAQRSLQGRRKKGDPLFPRYVKGGVLNSNSASAALNKWLSTYVPKGCSVHSMRHAMRDRLRAVECPSDIVDQIGGWTTAGVGHGYGQGYPLSVLRKWMKKIE
jgi:integrase